MSSVNGPSTSSLAGREALSSSPNRISTPARERGIEPPRHKDTKPCLLCGPGGRQRAERCSALRKQFRISSFEFRTSARGGRPLELPLAAPGAWRSGCDEGRKGTALEMGEGGEGELERLFEVAPVVFVMHGEFFEGFHRQGRLALRSDDQGQAREERGEACAVEGIEIAGVSPLRLLTR